MPALPFTSTLAIPLIGALLAGPPSAIELDLIGGESRVVHERVEAHGLVVRGAYEVVALASDGTRRTLAVREAAEARLRPEDARLDVVAARARAAALLGCLDCEPSEFDAQLVYLRQLDETVLAWELSSPLRWSPRPTRERLWLSAVDGTLLARRPLVFDSGALVYPEDPSSTPVAIPIEFATLDVELPDLPLSSTGSPNTSWPTVQVRGCVDASDEAPPPWWTEGQCLPWARARSDESGDYFAALPNLGLTADNEAFDDPYAEVAAYYYVEQFFARMAERGLDSHRCESFDVVVNQYSLDVEDGEGGERRPLGGANFVDECDHDLSPTLIIGQGTYVDYAWDADIIFHEMGHSVIQHLSPEGLTDRQFLATGIVSEAGALNEGLADYLAMTLAGDPEVGEYVGRFSVDLGTPYIRTGQNDKVCPDDLVGQWHNDGLIASGALWSARTRLGEASLLLDQILLQTLPRLAPDSTLDDFGRAFMTTAAEFVAANVLSPAHYELLERTFAGRGLLDCVHVIDDVGLATLGKRMVMIANDDAIAPFAPGPLQLRYEVPAGETEVTVFFAMSRTSGDGELGATVLLRRDGEPVAFEYASVNGVVEVSGEWDVQVEAESLNGQDFIARVPVEAGEVVHVALANTSAGGASVSNFFVVASDADDEPGELEAEEPGCGCTSETRGGATGFAVVLMLLGFTRRRRVTSAQA